MKTLRDPTVPPPVMPQGRPCGERALQNAHGFDKDHWPDLAIDDGERLGPAASAGRPPATQGRVSLAGGVMRPRRQDV